MVIWYYGYRPKGRQDWSASGRLADCTLAEADWPTVADKSATSPLIKKYVEKNYSLGKSVEHSAKVKGKGGARQNFFFFFFCEICVESTQKSSLFEKLFCEARFWFPEKNKK